MVDSAKVKRSMIGVIITSAVLLVPSVLIWLVNIAVAGGTLFSRILPESIITAFTPLAADYSTVTTLVPVLIFLFPIIAAVMVIKRLDTDEPMAALPWLPYPHRFGFFLVMLGLTGTLYGLLIGMSSSGVSTLTAETAADSISEALERLLNGTATALLSSLAGLAGAFAAAEPLTWVFRHFAGVVEAEEDVALSETLDILTNDLMELSKASREVRELIAPEKAQGLYDVLNHMDESVTNVLSGIGGVNDKLEQISKAQKEANDSLQLLTRLESMDESAKSTLEKLGSLEAMADVSKSIDSRIDGLGTCLASIQERADRSNELMGLLVKEIQSQGDSRKNELGSILNAITQNNSDMKKDRDSIRKAFAMYGSVD